MTEKSPDDILALCSRFNLDQESYRVFPKKEAPASSRGLPKQRVTEIPHRAPERIHDETRPVRRFEPDVIEESDERSSTNQTDIAALRNLLRHISGPTVSDRTREIQDLLRTSVVTHAAGGGVGCTTVIATLARLLSRRNKSCAIADSGVNSLLPFFFGGHRVSYGHRRVGGLRTALESPVRIITPDAWNSNSAEGETQQRWLERNLRQLRGEVDCLLVDGCTMAGMPISHSVPGGVALIVAVPDVSCVLGAGALKQALNEHAPDREVIAVLNKFECSLPIHVEIHRWFEENFDQVVTLRRSDLVNEALAEGLTVIDWAPDSDLAQDFGRLLKTVERPLQMQLSFQEQKGF